MKQKSFAIIVFMLFFFLIQLSFAKDYSNPSATIAYTLNKNGTINVHEEIVYSISCPTSDCYHELYTWHPKSLKIESASGYCIETQCRFYTQYNQGRYELVLRKDDGFKSGTYTAVFDYTLPEEILEQKDAAQFFYKVWYDQWPKDIGTLRITIVLPNSGSETLLYTHNSTSSQINTIENKIEIVAENYPSNNYYEVNLLMPKSWFTSLRKADNYMAREEIIKKEENYLGQQNDTGIIGLFSIIYGFILVIFPLLLFIYLYLVYGKDENLPELQSLPPYIRDISEVGDDISPTEAAILLSPIASNQVNPDFLSHIIAAETMELIRLGYLQAEERETKEIFGASKKIDLIPVADMDTSKLTDIQRTVLEFIKSNLENGRFSYDKGKLRSYEIDSFYSANAFRFAFLGFANGLIAKCINLVKSKNYIDVTGQNLMNIGFTIWFFVSLGSLMFMVPFFPTLLIFLPLLFISIFGYSFLLLITNMRPDLLGRWSREGRIMHEKILRYYTFMKELTLMKEKGIKDVILWERLLVYATAFGIADQVVKAMDVIVPEYKSNVRLKSYAVFAVSISNSTRGTVSAYMSSGRSRGGGGAGGGGGGGGGGAR
ncbi:MAG: DUF2207 domain-containing protein [Candidatus Micrarchaeia archaeon]